MKGLIAFLFSLGPVGVEFYITYLKSLVLKDLRTVMSRATTGSEPTPSLESC